MSNIYTALVTPFKEDYSIDYDSINNLLLHQLENGITGGVFFGSTGEGRTVSYEEKLSILNHVLAIKNIYKEKESFDNSIKERQDSGSPIIDFIYDITSHSNFNDIKSNIELWNSEKLESIYTLIKNLNYKIIVGVGGDDTMETAKFAMECKNIGCDEIMVTVPAYNKPNQTGIYNHFATIAKVVQNEKKTDLKSSKIFFEKKEDDYLDFTPSNFGLPILMYNIPSRTGINMSADTISRLRKEFPHIYAIKEASGSIDKVWEIKSLCDIGVMAGDDTMYLPVTSIGGIGVVSVLSNVSPDLMVSLREKKEFNFTKEIYPKVKAMFCDTNPIAVKYALYKKGIITNESVRLPLTELSSDKKVLVDTIFGF